ncbi:hypothetical protein JTE90_024404 [Oedothorax gibbosus]|uniref:Uncharacterized protein n=1 Tax=Oedothorax gibbosus TaxID=931172 RepID=A0AAV6TTA7_9ARAC|nr:hypothetical protein JTE90_024404 [Oedothorax gibbosus]
MRKYQDIIYVWEYKVQAPEDFMHKPLKVEGAFLSPKLITLNSYKPNGVLIAVLGFFLICYGVFGRYLSSSLAFDVDTAQTLVGDAFMSAILSAIAASIGKLFITDQD